ncbi:PEP anchor domain-containing protein [Oleiphilus messinensis]|uniref:PEP anchor domain-containing protein n=1 Tax=Oleiphilus messinensis TaxID=141451 RepID=A0A1Y0IBY4_9GAMM|nr:PEP-CTERM sorting domain-containing protein [Oleiphilus messinensis]ARU58037.1 PEP anchor domain-containing protein [Oleiphilus messinensis]
MKKLLLACGLVSVLASQAQATLITNGDFENLQLSGNSWGVFSSIPGWQTTLGSGIEVQRNTIVQAQSGQQYVELDAYNNSAITQGIDTLLGETYLLSFYYMPRTNNGNNDNGLGVFWDNFDKDYSNFDPSHEVFQIEDITHLQQPSWTQFTLELTATSDFMALSFGGQGANNSLGAFIDNVELTHVVPEPGTLALIGLGIAGIGLSMRKKA